MKELISARLDDEISDAERLTLAQHLPHCADCRRFDASTESMHRQFRIAEVPAVPDLSGAILTRMQTPAASLRNDVLRAVAAGLGVTKVAVALSTLMAVFGGATAHAGLELAAVDLAIGVALLLAAWQPARMSGLLPVFAVLAVATLFVGLGDVASGRVTWQEESFHLFDILGAVVVWRLIAPFSAEKRSRLIPV